MIYTIYGNQVKLLNFFKDDISNLRAKGVWFKLKIKGKEKIHETHISQLKADNGIIEISETMRKLNPEKYKEIMSN
jgi:hypothetical protein